MIATIAAVSPSGSSGSQPAIESYVSTYTSKPPVRTRITNAPVSAFWKSRMVPHTIICHATVAPRASSTPSSGAVSACVRGTPIRAGPIRATVCSIAAMLAP